MTMESLMMRQYFRNTQNTRANPDLQDDDDDNDGIPDHLDKDNDDTLNILSVDTDGDGVLTFDEFQDFFTN